MPNRKQVKQLLYEFLYEGLVSKSLDGVLACLSSDICGIGIGEQGFVSSLDDVRRVYNSGLKFDDTATHSIDLGRVEMIVLEERFAFVCADVLLTSHASCDDTATHTQFQQSLSMTNASGEWKICGLHATAPTVTQESLETYPLYFAEKTLRSLKEKIGEEAYRHEEQYRKAVLEDAIAFYIVNFTTNTFEKCQTQNDLCIYAEPNAPYTSFVEQFTPVRVYPDDIPSFLHTMSLDNILLAFQRHDNEVSCDYRGSYPDGSGYFWARTIIRLITDVNTGDLKGIIYVKNIDDDVREAQRERENSDYDSLTGLLNRTAMARAVNKRTHTGHNPVGGILLIIDVDLFRSITDTFGAPVGDQVLTQLAQLLRDSFGEAAIVGRLGIDKFGVFLLGQRPGSALQQRTTRLLEATHGIGIESPVEKMHTTISVGVAHLDSGSFEELYQLADKAMCEAKRDGRDTVAGI